MNSLLIPLAIGLGIGALLGVLGGGGSILTVPALVYLALVPPKDAIATSFVVVGITSAVGAARAWRAGRVNGRLALTFGAAAMLGAFTGARLGPMLRSDVQLTLLGALMLGAAAGMWKRKPDTTPPPRANHPGLLGVTGLGVGVLTGLVGIGGGFLIVPALTMLAGLPMAEAIGTSLTVIAMNSAAGFAGVVRHTTVPWGTAWLVTGGALLGLVLGGQLGDRLSTAQLRRGFAIFLVALAGLLLYKNRTIFSASGTSPEAERVHSAFFAPRTLTPHSYVHVYDYQRHAPSRRLTRA